MGSIEFETLRDALAEAARREVLGIMPEKGVCLDCAVEYSDDSGQTTKLTTEDYVSLLVGHHVLGPGLQSPQRVLFSMFSGRSHRRGKARSHVP